MNAKRSLMLLVLTCTACSQDPAPKVSVEAPVEVYVVEVPELQVGVPAQLLLDVRTGRPTAGVEITIEGDEGLRVADYAPKVLPATEPTSGWQVFVDVVPTSGGTWKLTVRLALHVNGDRPIHIVTLPLTVSSPILVPPVSYRSLKPDPLGNKDSNGRTIS